jgi:chaperonin GroES
VARTLTPLGDRIVIKAIEQESQTKSGLYIPDNAKERPQEGSVLAVGPGRVTDDGTRIAMEVAVGDTVVYSKFAGTEFTEDGEELLILTERDILAKVG